MYNVELVRQLVKEEGLTDREVAEKIGCTRVTITRIRERHNIGLRIVDNRKDKSYKCFVCGEKVFIRRKEPLKATCEKCSAQL